MTTESAAASTTIPIVMTVGVEPVAAGLWRASRNQATTSPGSQSVLLRADRVLQ